MFNTPWSLKTFDGREKACCAAATRDVLPASIADRVKSPYPSTQDPGYEKAVRGDLADLLSDQDAPVRRLIAPDKHPLGGGRAADRAGASRSTARRWRTCSSSTRG